MAHMAVSLGRGFPAVSQRATGDEEQGGVDFSLIVPLFNEEENVAALVDALRGFLADLPLAWEVLLIDDGSRDRTRERIEEAIAGRAGFRCYSFRINLGKSAVYSLGFRKARGRFIATMDGDLQDDPADLLPMLAKLQEGYDLVIGWKWEGKSGPAKKLCSILFNSVVRWTTGQSLHDVNCPLRVFRRECVRNTRLTGDSFRYFPLLVAWKGFKVAEVKVRNRPRLAGASKYGLRRYGQAFFDLFTLLFLHRYRQKPMHFFGLFGAGSFAAGFAIDAALTLRGLFITGVIGHQALLLLGVFLMLMGLQILLFGFMAVLIGEREERQRDDPAAYLD